MPEVQPNLVTRTEFAKKCGVTAMAITNAVRDDRVEIDKESNKVDLNNEKNQKYQSSNNHQRKGGDKKSDNPEARDISDLSLSELTESELKRLKLVEEVKAKRQKLAIERGEYLDLDLVKKVLNNVYAYAKKEMVNLGRNSAPKIISILNASESHLPEIAHEIEGEVYKILQNEKSMLIGFIGEIEDDE